MNPIGRLLADLDAGLDGAACAGRHELFDPAEPGEDRDLLDYRHRAAARICASCPVLDKCAEVVADMPRSTRAGVWAAVAYDGRGRPTRIPQEDR